MRTFLRLKSSFSFLVLGIALLGTQYGAFAQLSLPVGTTYTETFDGIGGGLPTGWTARTGATATTRGTSPAAFTTTPGTTTAWSDTGGAFKNLASADALASNATTPNQTAAADRSLGIRQSGSFGDPGASFELAIANTTGRTGFNIALKHQMLRVETRSTVWSVQYSTNGGTVWTTSGTFADPAAFGNTAGNYSLGTALDNLPGNVLIRVVALTAAGGSGSRDTYGIDDFELTWTNTPSNAAPTASVNAISGTLTVGQVLTGSYTYNDADADAEGTSTFRWFTADNAAGLNETAIAGQTGSTYTLVLGDVNKYIRFGVTPVAATGTSPGVEAFSAYAGPVTTGANSNSTITVDAGFVPATNFDYTVYTDGDVTASSFEIARFSLNDVAGTPDDDLATTLNNLTFSLSNFTNVQKVAIYDDTNTEIQELTAAAALNFTALNIVADSGASKSFSVRVTFKTVVADNAQLQLTITAATADIAGSFFSSVDAGGASSSISGDDNRIEVIGSTLAFVQQPSNTVVGVNMSPAVTVRVIDANSNTDVDYTEYIQVGASDAMSTMGYEQAVAGVATFGGLNFAVAQSNLTLEANALGLNFATSNTFNVSVQAAGELLMEDNVTYTGNIYPSQFSINVNAAGSSPIVAGASGLSYNAYGSTAIGNAITMSNSGEDVGKDIVPDLASGSTFYISFLVNVTTPRTGDYFFAVLPTGSTSTLKGRVYVKSSSTNGFVNFGVANASSAPGAVEYGTANYAVGATHLVVLKFNFTNGGTETATLFVNPNVYSEPTTPEVSVSNPSTLANVGFYALRQGATGSAANLTIDGIRVATNWGTALGNPQYDANASIATGNYNTVTVLNGTLTAAGSVTVNNEILVNNGGDFVIPNNVNLIQHGTTNNNSGNITVKRDATMKRLDYTYWGSPVANQDLKLFSPYTVSPTNVQDIPTPTGASRFYTLNEATNAFEAIVEPLGVNFEAAKGYMLRAPNNFPSNGTPTVFNGSFNGVPNNGDLSINVTNSGSGMNMLSNPYPSTIDADAFLDANTSLETLYFWTHPATPSNVAGANYATYNALGAAAASATTPPSATPNGTIQVGQGFIAKTNAATTVNYTNALRVNNTAGQFFRGVANEKNRFWLNLSSDNNALNQILTGYATNATNDLDSRYDAKLIENEGSKLYNLVNNSAYVIQGRALPFSQDDVVALGFRAANAGNYTIALGNFDGLFSLDQAIYIKDNLTGITHDVKDGAYTFASEAGTFNERFSVVYQNVTLGVENPAVDANSIVVFTKNNTITINSGNVMMENVKLFDIRGRLLFEQKGINAATTSIHNLKATQQVLIVQVTANNQTISKKVVY